MKGVEQPSTATSTEAETVEAKAKRELDSLSDSAAASSTTPTSAKGIVEQIQVCFFGVPDHGVKFLAWEKR